MSRHVEIVGGGFAGLVAATAFAQRGWSVRLHERGPQVRAFGAGIFIWQNGIHVMRAIGAYDDMMRNAHEAPKYFARDADGVLIGTDTFGAQTGCRMLTMTRQTLHSAILAAAERSGVEIRLNSNVTSASPLGEIRTEDGSDFRADLVVGADGVNSNVRDSLGLMDYREKTGFGGMRLLIPREPTDSEHIQSFRSPGSRMTHYVPCDPENIYLCFTTSADDAPGCALPFDKKAWGETFPRLRALYSRIGDQGRWDHYETIKLKAWSKGRVAIIGDAAHAMTPSLGQGAGCSMMNALSLAAAASAGPVTEAMLVRWERQERPLTEHTQDYAQSTTQRGPILGSSGTKWTDDALRAAKHVPTAAMEVAGTA